MTSDERRPSPDSSMPRHETLTSEVDSLHGPATTTTPHAPPPVSGQPKVWHEMGNFMRRVTAPLKISLVLENKGNVARDHLASERTYLAYMRTSLACASAGVAVVQLLLLNTTSTTSPKSRIDPAMFARPLGAALILFGLVMLVFGLLRYFTTQSALVGGYFPVARHSVTVMGCMLGALVCVVFAVVVAGTHR